MTAQAVLIRCTRFNSRNNGRTIAEGGRSMEISVSHRSGIRPGKRATARIYPAGMLMAKPINSDDTT